MSSLQQNRDSTNRFESVKYYCSQLPHEGWVELCDLAEGQGYSNPADLSLRDFGMLVSGSDLCYAYACLEVFREKEEPSSSSRFINFVSASRSTDPTGGVHETTSHTSYSEGRMPSYGEGRMPFDPKGGAGYERELSRQVLMLQSSVKEIRDSIESMVHRFETSISRMESQVNGLEASIDLRLSCLESAAEMRAISLADISHKFEDDAFSSGSLNESLSAALMTRSLEEFITESCKKIVTEYEFCGDISVGVNEKIIFQLLGAGRGNAAHQVLIVEKLGSTLTPFKNRCSEVRSPLRSSSLAMPSTSTVGPTPGKPAGTSKVRSLLSAVRKSI